MNKLKKKYSAVWPVPRATLSFDRKRKKLFDSNTDRSKKAFYKNN